MIALALFFILPVSFLSFGHLLISRINSSDNSSLPSEIYNVTSFCLGAVIFSYFWFVMSLVCGIHWSSVIGYIGLSGLSIWLTRNYLAQVGKSIRSSVSSFFSSSLSVKCLGLLFLVSLSSTFMRCFSAHIQGDSLVYHLYLVKQFVLEGAFWKVPFSEHLFNPRGAQMGLVMGELLQSLALSKYFSFLLFIAFAWIPGCYLYYQTKNIKAALMASLCIACMPVVFSHAPSAYNDLAFSLYLVLPFLLLLIAARNQEFTGGLALITGLLAGFSLACKYLGFFGMIGFVPLLIYLIVKVQDKGQLLKCAGLFIIGLLLTSSPYYIQSYLDTGNPVFPYAANLFDTPFGYEAPGFETKSEFPRGSGGGIGLLPFLSLPWNLTFHPELFGGDQLGFLFLIFGVLILVALRKNILIALYCLLFLLLWFVLTQFTRYLLSIFAFFAILLAIGYVAVQNRFRWVGRGIVILFCLVVSLQTAWAGYRAYKDLVIRKPHPLVEVADHMNAVIEDASEKVLVIREPRLYYFDFAGFRERTFRNFTRYPEKSATETADLLAELGVRYILYRTPVVGLPSVPDETGFDPLHYFLPLLQSGDYQERTTFQSSDSYHYILIENTSFKSA